MTEFESALGNDPIIRAACDRERFGRGLMNVGLGICLGNMLFALAMGWVGPTTLIDPNAVIPYGPLAVTGLGVAVMLFGWVQIAKAQATTAKRCGDLLQQHLKGHVVN